MGLFGFGGDEEEDKLSNVPLFSEPVDPGWVHARDGDFFPFLTLDPEEMGLNKIGGVFLIWHAGVRPEWVYAGHSTDLAAAFHHAGNNSDITEYEVNGGLFVTWAPVLPEYRASVVKYIDEHFKTLVPNPSAYNAKTRIAPVTPPQRQKKTQMKPSRTPPLA